MNSRMRYATVVLVTLSLLLPTLLLAKRAKRDFEAEAKQGLQELNEALVTLAERLVLLEEDLIELDGNIVKLGIERPIAKQQREPYWKAWSRATFEKPIEFRRGDVSGGSQRGESAKGWFFSAETHDQPIRGLLHIIRTRGSHLWRRDVKLHSVITGTLPARVRAAYTFLSRMLERLKTRNSWCLAVERLPERIRLVQQLRLELHGWRIKVYEYDSSIFVDPDAVEEEPEPPPVVGDDDDSLPIGDDDDATDEPLTGQDEVIVTGEGEPEEEKPVVVLPVIDPEEAKRLAEEAQKEADALHQSFYHVMKRGDTLTGVIAKRMRGAGWGRRDIRNFLYNDGGCTAVARMNGYADADYIWVDARVYVPPFPKKDDESSRETLKNWLGALCIADNECGAPKQPFSRNETIMRGRQIKNFARFLRDKLPAKATSASMATLMKNEGLSDAVFVSSVKLYYFIEDLKERGHAKGMPRWADKLQERADALFRAHRACEQDSTATTRKALAAEVKAYRGIFSK